MGLIQLLEGLSPWHWWALVVILLVIEVLTNTTYLLWPAAAAAVVALVSSLLPWGWEMQLGAFAGLTIALSLLGDRFVARRWLKGGDDRHATLNERAQQLAGQKVVALTDFAAGRGRVKVGDSVWAAMLTGDGVVTRDVVVTRGDVLEVVEVDGATLKVKPLTTKGLKVGPS